MRRSLIGSVSHILARLRSAAPSPPAFTLADDEPLATLPALLFDTETTGLDVMRDRIISMAGLPYHGGGADDAPALDLLLHPGIRIPKASTAIHGIDDRMVATAPALALLWGSIQHAWQGRVLVGHNIGFDIALLQHEASRYRLPFHAPAGALDIGLLYAGLKPRVAHITLERIAEDFAVSLEGRHSATGDAEAAAGIWQRMLPALGRIGIATLGDARRLMQRQRDLLHGQDRAGWALDLLLPR
ncbi:3'-5' exonuclease [Ferrovibrio terrae]|uniref:3'-5' exonuclease n=1 Tax=Ferrovibrio terrae TaxID=2594003 RepID=A0A516H6V4_9PROT|nr:3'-5' exonuclease [Ferrovibrio terrae]QDO99513.1 3'-5' exonuclease [Ferrovibrio terrae]